MSNAITQNPKALRTLIASPLNEALFDAHKHPYMNLQLTDPNARDVMADLVSCALDRSARVSYRVAHDGQHARAVGTWRGELGLCPSWSTDRPSERCLQLVSSCLFARTNRLHKKIPVRFGIPKLLPARDRVAVATYTRTPEDGNAVDGTEIAAFGRGWTPGYIGSCAPNQPFALSVPDAQCARAAVRVCSGIHGCNESSASRLAEQRGACDGTPVVFTCPDDGFFGVMTNPRVEVVHRGAGTGSYPATEAEVFPFLEGAFFGNLFDPEGLTRSREMVLDHGRAERHVSKIAHNAADDDDDDDDAVPHRHIYACYSLANEEEGVAYLDSRICVKRGSKNKCFPNAPRRCHFKDADLNQSKGYHCKWRSDDGFYRECVGDDGVTYPSMTVYLHEPCGMTDEGCPSSLPKAPPD